MLITRQIYGDMSKKMKLHLKQLLVIGLQISMSLLIQHILRYLKEKTSMKSRIALLKFSESLTCQKVDVTLGQDPLAPK